ncbi:RhoGAP [Nesidiocoris tenuis]|uniref:RhoGAP n=1 Tax=Nesidiocoris tenuis TaxID=355587 RepID=A0ABN7AYB3_9HEMI|nr:RhoGAP [Nesidiocoris tenuis]
MRAGKMYINQDEVFVSCLPMPIFSSSPRPQLRRWGSVGSWTPVDHERLDLNNSTVSAAEDYTKRRHVFRLSTPSSSEILLQADTADEMQRWLSALASHENVTQLTNTSGSGQNISPVAAHKGIMKNITTPFRNRSPTGQSPVSKTRKPSQGDVTVVAPKSKTWKVRMAKQLKKIQSGSGSPVSPTAPTSYPEGATIGVPLEHCPKSNSNIYVPYIVELCTRIVEERGLDIIGIYRVPGNTAAITSLKEAVNKGLKDALLDQDQRWSDVNVISSLLKLFFRKLPDCLLTTELYPSFIKADKIEDSQQRIICIRNLVHELPDHHHHTLRHLMMHLKLVVEHSDVNKMEARNLAIVFGPTLVRANDDNMVTMVTDMSHQCRIVESLIQHADWCFSDDSLDSLRLNESIDSSGPVQESESAMPNQSLLLGNVHKLEGMKGGGGSEVSRRDIVTSIITAANKKMMKSKARKQVTSAGEEIHASEARGDKRKDSGGGRKGSGGGGEAEAADLKSLVAGAVAAGVRDSVLFSETIIAPTLIDSDKEDGSKVVEPPKQVTANDGTIITYQGLSETTQARIKRFEMETKAMLQRDKILNNKDWLKPSAPPAIGSKIADRGQAGSNESLPSPLAKWKQITSPPRNQLSSSSVDSSSTEGLSRSVGGESPLSRPVHAHHHQRANDNQRLVRVASLDSLTDSSSEVGPTSGSHRHSGPVIKVGTTPSVTTVSSNTTNDSAASNTDLVSSLTLTFDAKLKSLGLTSPTSEKHEEKSDKDVSSSFRDPSLHRSFTSPNLEFKIMEFPVEEDKQKKVEEKTEKVEVEKDDEKENCAVSGGKLKRSESFKQREEKKENSNNKLLRRSESLNKGSASNKLKRSDSLTKTEKTDLNLSKRRQALEAATKKMKRKTGGGGERSIKRRHTVGGTKDFDKAAWLDNKEREASEERRTSSPDLSTDLSRPVLVLRPHSLLADSPLESHI